jgi:Cu/Ag efflux pump CusA
MTMVWKFDLNTKTVVSGSHLKISDVFQGIPNGINAAMIYDSSTVYFFKDLR